MRELRPAKFVCDVADAMGVNRNPVFDLLRQQRIDALFYFLFLTGYVGVP